MTVLEMRAAIFLFAASPVRSQDAAWACEDALPLPAAESRPKPRLFGRVRRLITALASI
jgi:hypothetical protein